VIRKKHCALQLHGWKRGEEHLKKKVALPKRWTKVPIRWSRRRHRGGRGGPDIRAKAAKEMGEEKKNLTEKSPKRRNTKRTNELNNTQTKAM